MVLNYLAQILLARMGSTTWTTLRAPWSTVLGTQYLPEKEEKQFETHGRPETDNVSELQNL